MKNHSILLLMTGFCLLTLPNSAGCAPVAAPVARNNGLSEVRDYQLPAWFQSANRVHAHTRLSRRLLDRPAFTNAGKHFRDMGFDVISRHIVSGSEGAWWPSAVGAILPEAVKRNIAKEIIDEAHANKLKIIVYYRHMEDAGMAKAHPEWICKDPEGKPYFKRGKKMCFNTPYREFVQTRLLELVDLGADGFYFDEKHQPPVCHCPACKANPKPREEIIREMILQYRAAIHKRNPKCVLLVSSQFRGCSHSLWRLPDICKFEQHIAYHYGGSGALGLALGLTFTRDAADGSPTHYWWSNTKPSTLHTSARTLAFGHIFNFDVKESGIDDPASDFYKMAMRHTALGRKLSPYLIAAPIAVRWATIHYPEGLPQGEAKINFVYPAFTTLVNRGLPSSIITNTQLREGIPADCQLLVLPDPKRAPLSNSAVKKHLDAFKARGGTVMLGVKKTFAAEVNAMRPKAPIFAISKTEKPAQFVLTAYRDKADTRRLALIVPHEAKAVLRDITVYLPAGRTPAKAINVMTGKPLAITKTNRGYQIALPDVKTLGGVSITWKK